MVGVWFPISMFIAIGFEHSVANMFILPAGLFSGQLVCKCLQDGQNYESSEMSSESGCAAENAVFVCFCQVHH